MSTAGPVLAQQPARWALLLWLVGVLAAGLLIARTPFSADLSAFLPKSPDARQQVLIEQLQSGVAARTFMIGIEGGQGADQRAAVSKTFAGKLRASGLFEQVQNGEDADWRDAGTFLFDHRYQLSPAVSAERFTVVGLKDALLDTLSTLGTPAGNAFRPLFERDPTGETSRIVEELVPASSPRSEGGVWVSREAPRAIILASTRASGDDLDAQALAITRIEAAFAESTQALRGGPKLLMSGTPVFSVQSRDRIQGEAVQLAAIGAVAVGGLLLLAFASLRALALAVLPVVTGVVAGTAGVSLVFGGVHALTMGFGSTLIGETVDYAIYYLIQARLGNAAGALRGWQIWRDTQWPTVRLGLWTSVCGFGALVFSGFPGLAQLGVFSLVGLVAAALTTRFVLPVLAPDGSPGMGLRRPMAVAAQAVVRVLPRLRTACMALAALALALVLWQGGQLWSGSLASMSPVPQAEQDLNGQLREDLGASDASTLVVVQAGDEQAVLRATEVTTGRLDPLVNNGVLAGYQSVTRVLPSLARQQARVASLPDAAELRVRVASAVESLPLAAGRLDPFIDEVVKARALAPVDRASLEGGPLAPLVRSLLLERPGGGWSALILLNEGPAFDPAALRTVLAGLPGVQAIDVKQELDSLYDRYLREALVQVMLGALAVLVLLALHLRSARRLLVVVRPLVLSVVLTLGGLAAGHLWLGWDGLGILHLVGLLLVVAVGSNYALFFDQLRQQSGLAKAAPDTLVSLMLANLTTVLSFGLIAQSDIPALSSIGRVVAPGALLALLLAAAFAQHRRPARAD